jgi:hypothetical protein
MKMLKRLYLIKFMLIVGGSLLPFLAQAQVFEFSVVSCQWHPSPHNFSSTQMGVKNLGSKTVDTLYLKYNVLDEKKKIFRSDSWFFKGIRQDKTIVDRVLAMDSISCQEISAIEIVSATCKFAGESKEYDCYNAIRPMPGALKVIK